MEQVLRAVDVEMKWLPARQGVAMLHERAAAFAKSGESSMGNAVRMWSAVCACALLGACGDAGTVAPVAAQHAAVEPIAADPTFRLTADRTDAHFAALPELVTLTRKSAYSSSDPWMVLGTVPALDAGGDISAAWHEQPDVSIILSWGDIDTAVVLTMRPDGPGRWVGVASFHDCNGSVITLPTPARLEFRDA